MNENDASLSPKQSCASAKSALRDLWVDGRLSELRSRGASNRPISSGARSDEDSSPSGAHRRAAGEQSTPPFAGVPSKLVDPAILRHLEHCPTCRQEADELDRLGQSLEVGLHSLCSAIAETMDEGIEGTLRQIREEPRDARLLRRVRRPLRFVLWLGFLAFTLLASALLAVAVYKVVAGL